MRIKNLILPVLAMVLGALCAAQAWGQARSIDTTHSKLLVHVSKAGLFSALGDNHEVEAPISEGFIDEAAGQVKFVVESQRLRVLDPESPPDKRQQVQERMLGPDVLDVAHFPRISFQSTAVEQAGPGQFLVRGQLSLHGQAHEVAVKVRTHGVGQIVSYAGSCTLKQREFGIAPVSAAGGTVKVKDELAIEFDIRVNSAPTAAR